MLFFIIFIVILVVIIANLGQYSDQVVTERREAKTEYIGRVGEETTYLDKAVALNIPIYSIIVFSDRCSIEYVPHSFKDVYI